MKETGVSLLVKKDLRIFLTAIGLGLISILLLNVYVRSKEKSEEMVTVLTAARPIPTGTSIEKGMIGDKQIPKYLSNDNIIGPADRELITGRTVKIDVPAGVPLLYNYLSAASAEDITDKLNPGERILRISLKGPVDFIKPNDRIDIIGTFSQPKDVTKILLQNVVVYDRAGSDLLLIVTFDEVLMLTHAITKGTLSFVPRNPTDRDVDLEKKEATISDIFPLSDKLTQLRKDREASKPIPIRKH